MARFVAAVVRPVENACSELRILATASTAPADLVSHEIANRYKSSFCNGTGAKKT
jgi:hypothetical protein